MKEITAADLRRRLTNPTRPFLLDVRQPEEFAAAHIDGSVLIPLTDLPARVGELTKDAEIIVICRSGARSGRACDFLTQSGFANVTNLSGGMLAWASST